MKLSRLPHDPSALIDFFQEGLESLGAVCERVWHDRLQILAEGAAARPWRPEGGLIETELHFPPAEATTPRAADKEVFPGCPLTFRLTEQLQSPSLSLERVAVQSSAQAKAPPPEVAEKLWHAQVPGTSRWKLTAPFLPAWHFSLLALLRCEIQAIDQHWSLHRLAISLPNGERDENLASTLDFAEIVPCDNVAWPAPALGDWHARLRQALEEDLIDDLAGIRRRQEQYLRRELERIDGYFENYEDELLGRQQRSQSDTSKSKNEQRLAATQAEHQRRRHDQIQRHEIRVIPHLDALLLLAEPAWEANLSLTRNNEARAEKALFVPRHRKWIQAR